jgi:hypothetical protein
VAQHSTYYTDFPPQAVDHTQPQRRIFNLNVQELKACGFALAIADGPDVRPDVAEEMGNACAKTSRL